MIRLRVLLTFFVLCGIASASREFDGIVSAIETHYGATRTHIPMMGIANLALKLAHPAGASGFHIALFQDLKTDLDDENQADLDRFMDGLSSPHLRPFIRTRSRYSGEATYIFCGEVGKTSQVLIATFNSHQATVVEAFVNFDTLARWLQSPEDAGKDFKGDISDDR